MFDIDLPVFWSSSQGHDTYLDSGHLLREREQRGRKRERENERERGEREE